MIKARSSQNIHSNPSPAARVEVARRQIERDYWFLKRHLATLADLMKKAEKNAATESSSERVIEELRGLTIRRGAAIFRELGEVRRAIAEHQKEPDK